MLKLIYCDGNDETIVDNSWPVPREKQKKVSERANFLERKRILDKNPNEKWRVGDLEGISYLTPGAPSGEMVLYYKILLLWRAGAKKR